MKINLAGFNIDANLAKEIKNQTQVTPEIISAAYARISRSKDSVTELREKALDQVEKSRARNENIIFEMGHSSIAEHAVFNFDIIGVSRFMSEFLQKSRLASFTEKSQRYVTLNGDYIIPKEITDECIKDEYQKAISKLTDLYKLLYSKAKEHLESTGFEGAKRELQGRAKEDARYVLPLSTETQMGMTINARNLERLLRRLDRCGFIEASELKEAIESQVKHIAPSIIKYTKSEEYECNNLGLNLAYEQSENEIELLNVTPNAEKKLLAHLISEEENIPFYSAQKIVNSFDDTKINNLYDKLFCNMKSYHPVPKVFETIDLEFELVMSSSCFAQLKRHRMSTILRSEYRPEAGVVIPPLLKDIKAENDILQVLRDLNSVYCKLENIKKGLGTYILTNAHKLRVYFKLNLREMYHFSRLRSDSHAQWEIRDLSLQMDNLVKEKLPVAAKFLMGKDQFNNR